jgi:hypothetical protein
MANQPLHYEFKVVFDGLELQPQMVDKINQAVQNVVLQEIANIDRQGDLAVRIPQATIGNGSTNGIVARVIAPGQMEGGAL